MRENLHWPLRAQKALGWRSRVLFRTEALWGEIPETLGPAVKASYVMEGKGGKDGYFLKKKISYKNRSICKTISQPGGSTSQFLGDRG